MTVESRDDTKCARVSQDSLDTFPRGALYEESWSDTECVRVSLDFQEYFFKGVHCMWNPGMILSVSEYPRIPRILFQRGILYVESWDDTECVRVSQDYQDTFPEGYTVCGILG